MAIKIGAGAGILALFMLLLADHFVFWRDAQIGLALLVAPFVAALVGVGVWLMVDAAWRPKVLSTSLRGRFITGAAIVVGVAMWYTGEALQFFGIW